MKARKPSVLVFVSEGDPDYLEEILAGLEEEGVPYEVQERTGTLDELAYAAAAEAVLGAGIGMAGKEAAMQMASLPLGRNVFTLNHPTFAQCRRLGMNCARAFKRRPFLPLSEGGEL